MTSGYSETSPNACDQQQVIVIISHQKMLANAKKRKVDAEGRDFKKIWTTKYIFTKVEGEYV